MIAALSPADINYEETLSTLRFADRAKSIKTKAVVNESATDRLIRELREENKRLAQLLSSGSAAAPSLGGEGNTEELENLRKQLEGNKREMEQMELTWQQRLQEEGKRSKTTDGEKALTEENKKKLPHFWNLNEDAALTGIIVHFISPGTSLVGNKQAQPPADVQLNGLSIQKEHATVTNRDNKKIGLAAMAGAEILVNGKRVVKDAQLEHNDRVLFGGNHLYVFAHPVQLAKQKKKKKKRSEQQHEITYEMAQAEIAENSGIMGMNKAAGGASKTKEDLILEEELVQLMPQVYRANAMSDELKKKVHFEIVLVAPQARGAPADGHTEIFVRVLNQADDLEFLWEKNKFINRYYGMQELYQNFIEGYSDWDVPVERDPFHEPQNSEVPIGGVHVYLQSLAYMVELDDQLPITDFRGAEHGHLQVSLVPCSPQGQEITGEFVDKPQDLVGKNLSFKVKVFGAIGLPRKFSRSRCSYTFYLENKEATTSEMAGSNPNYSHEKIFSFKPVTKQLVDYLKDSALYIQVLGRQIGKGNQRRRPSLPTYNQPTDANHLKHVEALLQAAIRKGSNQISVKDLAAAMGVSSLSSSSSPLSAAPAKRAKGHSQPKSASSGDSAIVKDKDVVGSTTKRKVSKKAKSKPK